MLGLVGFLAKLVLGFDFDIGRGGGVTDNRALEWTKLFGCVNGVFWFWTPQTPYLELGPAQRKQRPMQQRLHCQSRSATAAPKRFGCRS